MRFEPRLFSDDDSVEGQLPDDLRALAEQLSDDATHLEKLYPAPRCGVAAASTTEPASRTLPQRRRIAWGRWSVAAAVLLALGMTGSWLFLSDVVPQQVAEVEQAGTNDKANEGAKSAVLSLNMFGELSGPEQEAMLDLLEENTQSAPSFSF